MQNRTGCTVYRRGQVSVLAKKTFKNDGKFGFGSPYLPPLLRSLDPPPVYFEKKL
jgi:hypothetical protein